MNKAPISEYAMVGDCRTAALVHVGGRVDWLCWPNFASPACFAALIGSPQNGHWSLAPLGGRAEFSRRYRPQTLVLETTMTVKDGTVVVTDFMPVGGHHSHLVRRVECLRGKVSMRTELCARFNYGDSVPWLRRQEEEDGHAWIGRVGPDLLVLRTAGELDEATPGTITGDFTIRAGQVCTFTLTYGCSVEDVPQAIDVDAELEKTQRFWTDWASRSRYRGPYRELVERSLLTLKALTYRSSGGIVAAPTTSLPERVGGALNWDYRYCWIRDATFTMSALIEAGYTEEVISWKEWLIRAVGQDASQVQILYGIGGERHISDWVVPWLDGYQSSKPVRVGNAAAKQKQQDIYGEIAAALFHAREAGVACAPEELSLQQRLTEHLTSIWNDPGSGMWEERDEPQRFTYSQVMAWVCLDRAIGAIERHGMSGPLAKWKKLRTKIHADVCKRGFHKRLNSFVQHYGSKRLDAALLLLPVVKFLPPDDPRILGTVKAIELELLNGGLLLRNLPKNSKAKQGAFLACSFWLVEVYVMTGRVAEARQLFEFAASRANDVGLLSEEYDTGHERLVGNFPQAFSHIALVRAAFRLAGCP